MPESETRTILRISPRRLSGTPAVPGGKSELIRAVFCASLCEGESRISNFSFSGDTEAALRAAEALGSEVRADGSNISVCGFCREPTGVFDCGESAAVLRFAVPAALAVCGGGSFTGRGRLMERPLAPYLELFDAWGTEYSLKDDRLLVSGKLPAGEHRISGSISSQFLSGLLTALPAAGGGKICVYDGLNSSGYADLTCRVMRHAGADAHRTGDCFAVSGSYAPFALTAAGDWSQAAFWYAACHFGADLKFENLQRGSSQPDEKMADLAERMKQPGDLQIDLSGTPDLLPPLAVMAAVRSGSCRFTGCRRLKYKESNRLLSVAELLCALGADAEADDDGITVHGKTILSGGRVECFGDHRIAMAAAAAACGCAGDVTVIGADCVNKSWPGFFREYERLGGFGCVSISGEKTED